MVPLPSGRRACGPPPEVTRTYWTPYAAELSS